MDLLKRSLAPIVAEAWELIDEEARDALDAHLAGRRVVDLDGPHGWKHAAINLGTLDMLDDQPAPDVDAALRNVLPLAEIRCPIVLDIMALDTAPRGAADVELGPVVDSCKQVARVEDDAIFNGSELLRIEGILPASPFDPVALPADPSGFPEAVVEAQEVLRRAGISGPHALVLGDEPFGALSQSTVDGYPTWDVVDGMLDGPIVRSSAVERGVLLSIRGGDFILTVGQDLSIGYAHRTKHIVELYLTESFTFRVLEPRAAVALT